MLLPNTKVLYRRRLCHFLGSVPDKDGEVFVFKIWERSLSRWKYLTFQKWELEIEFECGSMHIV